MGKPRALFLDRDGTLIRDAHYLKDPDKVEIIETAGPALAKAKEAGYLLFMHTNQSGIARGYYDWSDVHACNLRMHHEFEWPEDFFSEICIAPESPDLQAILLAVRKYNFHLNKSWSDHHLRW